MAISDFESDIPQLKWKFIGTGPNGEKMYQFKKDKHCIAGIIRCYPDEKKWLVKLKVKNTKGKSFTYEFEDIEGPIIAVNDAFHAWTSSITDVRGHMGKEESDLKQWLRSFRN
jgi:hypothetical protein